MKRSSYLDIFSLSAIGIAHPILEQLATNPEFFVVKHSEAIDIIALTFVLILVVPLLLLGLVLVAGLIHPKAGRTTFYSVLFLLFAIAGSTALNRVFPMPALLQIAVTLAIAGFVLYGYVRFDSIRSTFPFLLVSLLLVPAVFLSKPSIRKILLPPEVSDVKLPPATSDIPIVMVLWDEFPLVSLLDQQNNIDPRIFPNLSELSKGSTFFRNASTISPWTDKAVTAILTGVYPNEEGLPTYYDYPKSLFTMLRGTYTYQVIERETRLCPTELCEEQWRRPDFVSRMKVTMEDASAVFLHIFLPLEFEEFLPPITKNWSQFWGKDEERHIEFQTFLDLIQPTNKPALFFLHSGFPHAPWTALPSQQIQNYIAQSIPAGASPKEKEALSQFRSHLMQVSYVDELIGRLVQKLKKTDLYDRSLLIITADHGIGLSRTEWERTITDRSYRDIMLVPLFIKLPHQKTGNVIDRNIETIDIIPTIGGVLKADTSWSTGVSAFDTSRPERAYKTVFSGGQLLKFEPHLSLNQTLKKEFFRQ